LAVGGSGNSQIHTSPKENLMLTIVLIVVLVLLLTGGGYGYSRRGR
jgi:hypothetical protein